MGLVFRWVTGLELQFVWDVRAMLYSMGVGEVPYSDLIIDAAEALSEGRVMYSGVSAQVSSKRGLHRLDDLEPGGRLHDEAIVMMRKGREEGEGGGEARFDQGGEGIGVVMRGVDVPTHMKPGRPLYPLPSYPPTLLPSYPLPSTLYPPTLLPSYPPTLYHLQFIPNPKSIHHAWSSPVSIIGRHTATLRIDGWPSGACMDRGTQNVARCAQCNPCW
jgi:hypothetical protein